MLQSEAAAVAGCSVSAIRKWRRLGLIRDRARVSQGGMRRIEVRLEDVVTRMRESMPSPRAVHPQPPADAAAPPVVAIPVPDLDAFVQHIAEAERRAAHAEAGSKASENMIQFLRDRVDDLEAELRASSQGPPTPAGPQVDAHLVAHEVRELRARMHKARQRGGDKDAEHQLAARFSHDAALLCLCYGLGIATQFKLGDGLTAAERTRLTAALARKGLHIGA